MARNFRWNRSLAAFGIGTFVGVVTGLAAAAAVYYPMTGFGVADERAKFVTTPLFLVVVAATVAAFVSAEVRAQRDERRLYRRLCRECGYDLRHLPPATWECPECRTPFRRS